MPLGVCTFCVCMCLCMCVRVCAALACAVTPVVAKKRHQPTPKAVALALAVSLALALVVAVAVATPSLTSPGELTAPQALLSEAVVVTAAEAVVIMVPRETVAPVAKTRETCGTCLLNQVRCDRDCACVCVCVAPHTPAKCAATVLWVHFVWVCAPMCARATGT
jgi:hypothetical protein